MSMHHHLCEHVHIQYVNICVYLHITINFKSITNKPLLNVMKPDAPVRVSDDVTNHAQMSGVRGELLNTVSNV